MIIAKSINQSTMSQGFFACIISNVFAFLQIHQSIKTADRNAYSALYVPPLKSFWFFKNTSFGNGKLFSTERARTHPYAFFKCSRSKRFWVTEWGEPLVSIFLETISTDFNLKIVMWKFSYKWKVLSNYFLTSIPWILGVVEVYKCLFSEAVDLKTNR